MSPEEILKYLLENYFFVNREGGLEWMYDEGKSIASEDKDFQIKLLPYLPDDMRHEIENHTGMGCLYRPASNANR